jgi:hypothetical protein
MLSGMLNVTAMAENNTDSAGSKNRIGINIRGGAGFESIDMFTTTSNEVSKISFGGGGGFGVKYGREFTSKFDAAFDLNYQFSSLNPELKNAKTVFSRWYMSVTPSYIFQLGKGATWKLKTGAGIDYYRFSSLKIESSKVPDGFNDTWKYNGSLGFHVTALVEHRFSEPISAYYGFSWYEVSHDYESGNLHQYTTDKRFVDANGSGLDLVVGLCFHF